MENWFNKLSSALLLLLLASVLWPSTQGYILYQESRILSQCTESVIANLRRPRRATCDTRYGRFAPAMARARGFPVVRPAVFVMGFSGNIQL